VTEFIQSSTAIKMNYAKTAWYAFGNHMFLKGASDEFFVTIILFFNMTENSL
jgi:hypothetical protein